MKQIVQGYLAFTSVPYRIVCLLLSPFATILISVLVERVTEGNISGVFVVPYFFLFGEIAGSYWLFGGILSKQAEKLTYLKTSPRGAGLLKNALITDMVRMFLYFFLEMACVQLLSLNRYPGHMLQTNPYSVWIYGDKGLIFSTILFGGYFCVILGVMTAKYFGYFRFVIAICYFLCVLITFIYYCSLRGPYAVLVVCVLLSVLACILDLWGSFKKIKGGYYDTAIKTGD